MINTTLSNPLNSTKLFLMDRYLNEMVDLYNLKKFPKILLLNGKKGIGKFTLAIHFLNYIFTHQEKNAYNLEDKSINPDSVFYNQLLNQTNQDVLLIKAEEKKKRKAKKKEKDAAVKVTPIPTKSTSDSLEINQRRRLSK